MVTAESFSKQLFDGVTLDEAQEAIDSGANTNISAYQPEVIIQPTREQREKFAKQVLYRTTGNHEPYGSTAA